MNITKHIPNAITCLNVLCGSLAVMIAFTGSAPLAIVSFLIILGAIFDFMDGMFARLLNAYSPMGKELDSLADLITFGLAPTAILFHYMKEVLVLESDSGMEPWLGLVFALSPFLMVIFSALRLAKFNVDTRQTDSFIGMPTPANALVILSIPLILQFDNDGFYYNLIVNKYFILGLTLVQCYFLVSEIPMFSLKFKNLKLADNTLRFGFLLSAVIMLIVFKFVGIPLVMMLYVLLSLIQALIQGKQVAQ